MNERTVEKEVFGIEQKRNKHLAGFMIPSGQRGDAVLEASTTRVLSNEGTMFFPMGSSTVSPLLSSAKRLERSDDHPRDEQSRFNLLLRRVKNRLKSAIIQT